MDTPQTAILVDETLDNVQRCAYNLSKVLAQQTADMAADDYEAPVNIKGVKELVQSLQALVEVAPFLKFRNAYHEIERVKEYLMQSQDVIGEARQPILEFLVAYQAYLFRET